MADVEITGNTPIRVAAPTPVTARVVSPVTSPLRVVPVAGPMGPAGPAGQDTAQALEVHVADSTPHPAYDDLPSLALLFENGMA